MSSADDFKNQGNQFLKEKKFNQAIEQYTKGIEIDGNHKVLFSNRSAAYLAMKKPQEALSDAEKAITIDPKWAKGYIRKINCLMSLNDVQNALMVGMEASKNGISDPALQKKIQDVLTIFQSQQNIFQKQMAEQKQRKEEAEREERIRKKKEEEEKKKEEQEKINQLPQMQAKLKGNVAYKNKNFEEALKHYNEAVSIDPDNVIFRLNRAAVYLETTEYEKCLKECEEALDKAYEVKADYVVKAKIHARIGNCYFRQEKYAEAINAYKESLLEKKIDSVKKQLKKCQNLIEKQRIEAYIDPKKGEEANKRAAEFFKKHQFADAKKEYDEAIKRDPKNGIYFSNRAAAYMKLGAVNYSIKDLEKALEYNPNFIKSYIRKAQCHIITKEYHKAIEMFEKGLKIEPDNKQLKARKEQLIIKINSEMSNKDDERASRAKDDPEIQRILRDPLMNKVLGELNDPKLAQAHLRDPVIAANVQKLINAGIIKTK